MRSAETSSSRMVFENRRVFVNGVELNVVVEGEGPGVLLVHGFPDDHDAWRAQIPALVAAGYRVIAPDTRGCGDSEMPPRVADYDLDVLVADLVALLDALGIQKVRLVGHDWGAIQGWWFVMRHPDRVERFIALSVGHPMAYLRGGLGQRLRRYYTTLIRFRWLNLMEFLVTRLDWLLFRLISAYPEEFPKWKARLSRPGRLTAGFNYYRANLKPGRLATNEHVAVPVVGIWSSRDRFVVERQMVRSGTYCDAGWRYVRVDGANHWMQIDDPVTVNRLLLESLAARVR